MSKLKTRFPEPVHAGHFARERLPLWIIVLACKDGTPGSYNSFLGILKDGVLKFAPELAPITENTTISDKVLDQIITAAPPSRDMSRFRRFLDHLWLWIRNRDAPTTEEEYQQRARDLDFDRLLGPAAAKTKILCACQPKPKQSPPVRKQVGIDACDALFDGGPIPRMQDKALAHRLEGHLGHHVPLHTAIRVRKNYERALRTAPTVKV